MLRKLLRLLAAVPALPALSVPALAADPVAYYTESSGSLPPPYAWKLEAGILSDGSVTVTYCLAYATEPPGCATATGRVAEDAISLITLTAARAGLPASPIREADDIPVGGGSSNAAVWIGGARFDVPAFPADADSQRADYLKATILSVVPVALVNQVKAATLAPSN